MTESRKMVPKENKLMHAAYIFVIWYGSSISWSIDSCENKVSADPYHMTYLGLKCRTHWGHVFFKVYCWPVYGLLLDGRLTYFHKLLEQSQKLRASLLGLAIKSIGWFSDGPESFVSRTLSLPRLIYSVQGHVHDVRAPYGISTANNNARKKWSV